MKTYEIWIFGESNAPFTMDSIHWMNGSCNYYTHAQFKADPRKFEGIRPHLIINVSEPFEELVHLQRHASVLNDAPILHLWN